MIWTDYNIDQVGDNFKVVGEWEGEVMGVNRDGSPKGYHLYKPGDVFIVNQGGWLCKAEEVAAMLMKYEINKVKTDAM
jgi:hypothetical protein